MAIATTTGGKPDPYYSAPTTTPGATYTGGGSSANAGLENTYTPGYYADTAGGQPTQHVVSGSTPAETKPQEPQGDQRVNPGIAKDQPKRPERTDYYARAVQEGISEQTIYMLANRPGGGIVPPNDEKAFYEYLKIAVGYQIASGQAAYTPVPKGRGALVNQLEYEANFSTAKGDAYAFPPEELNYTPLKPNLSTPQGDAYAFPLDYSTIQSDYQQSKVFAKGLVASAPGDPFALVVAEQAKAGGYTATPAEQSALYTNLKGEVANAEIDKQNRYSFAGISIVKPSVAMSNFLVAGGVGQGSAPSFVPTWVKAAVATPFMFAAGIVELPIAGFAWASYQVGEGRKVMAGNFVSKGVVQTVAQENRAGLQRINEGMYKPAVEGDPYFYGGVLFAAGVAGTATILARGKPAPPQMKAGAVTSDVSLANVQKGINYDFFGRELKVARVQRDIAIDRTGGNVKVTSDVTRSNFPEPYAKGGYDVTMKPNFNPSVKVSGVLGEVAKPFERQTLIGGGRARMGSTPSGNVITEASPDGVFTFDNQYLKVDTAASRLSGFVRESTPGGQGNINVNDVSFAARFASKDVNKVGDYARPLLEKYDYARVKVQVGAESEKGLGVFKAPERSPITPAAKEVRGYPQADWAIKGKPPSKFETLRDNLNVLNRKIEQVKTFQGTENPQSGGMAAKTQAKTVQAFDLRTVATESTDQAQWSWERPTQRVGVRPGLTLMGDYSQLMTGTTIRPGVAVQARDRMITEPRAPFKPAFAQTVGMGEATALKPVTIGQTRAIPPVAVTITKPQTVVNFKTETTIKPITKVTQVTVPVAVTITKPQIRGINDAPPPPIPPPEKTGLPLPWLPDVPRGSGGGRSFEPGLVKRGFKSQYRPSLAAGILGITAKKAPKVTLGFEIRPIVKGGKKK